MISSDIQVAGDEDGDDDENDDGDGDDCDENDDGDVNDDDDEDDDCDVTVQFRLLQKSKMPKASVKIFPRKSSRCCQEMHNL